MPSNEAQIDADAYKRRIFGRENFAQVRQHKMSCDTMVCLPFTGAGKAGDAAFGY